MSVINTNITSLIGQSNLSKSQSALQTSMERLSSGLRINSAKDDAAGQAIANRMTAQINGLAQAQRNANDGISVAQTAEGALNQINDNLQRIRELTVQAQNGTNSANDLSSIQEEIDQRLTEINRISEQTDFNDVKVLDTDTPLRIQVGANDGEFIEVALQTINTGTLEIANFQVGGMVEADNDAATDALFGDFTDDTTGPFDVDGVDGTITASYTSPEADADDVIGAMGEGDTVVHDGTTWVKQEDGSFVDQGDDTNTLADDTALAGAIDVQNDGDAVFSIGGTEYTITNDGGNDSVTSGGQDVYASLGGVLTTTEEVYYKLDDDSIVNAEGQTMYVDGDGALTTDATRMEPMEGVTPDPLATLDNALNKIDTLRSELGAVQNRFEDAITNLNTNETNLAAARSRIEDADYAVEVANMTRAQILQQAGTSVLAQANQIPQNVLSLLG